MKKIEENTISRNGIQKVILGENLLAAKSAVRTTITTCTVPTNTSIENSGTIAHENDNGTDFSGDSGGAK